MTAAEVLHSTIETFSKFMNISCSIDENSQIIRLIINEEKKIFSGSTYMIEALNYLSGLDKGFIEGLAYGMKKAREIIAQI